MMTIPRSFSLILTSVFLEVSATSGCVHPDSPAGRAAEDAKKALRKAGDKTTETATKASDQFEQAARKAGDAISDAVDDVRDATNTNSKKEDEEE
ncbi:MAG: hypothetical protein AAGD10_01160 [Myxococcota bacterium]